MPWISRRYRDDPDVLSGGHIRLVTPGELELQVGRDRLADDVDPLHGAARCSAVAD